VVIVERDPVIRFLLASPIPLSGALVQRAVGALYRRLAFCEPRRIDPRVARTFASHIGTKAHVARIVELLQRLLPELREPLRFDTIAPPVLLVWGDRDRLISLNGIERVTAAARDSRFVTIAGCGHCPQIEAPERLVEVLIRFEAELDA